MFGAPILHHKWLWDSITLNEVQSTTSSSYCCVEAVIARYVIVDIIAPYPACVHYSFHNVIVLSILLFHPYSSFFYLWNNSAHLLACYRSENKSLDSTTNSEMVEELVNQAEHGGLENGKVPPQRTTTLKLGGSPLHHNSHGFEQKKEQPYVLPIPLDAPPILSSPNESITTPPSVITTPSTSSSSQLKQQLPQGFSYISGGFELEKPSGTTNDMALGEFGEKKQSQVCHPD